MSQNAYSQRQNVRVQNSNVYTDERIRKFLEALSTSGGKNGWNVAKNIMPRLISAGIRGKSRVSRGCFDCHDAGGAWLR